MSLFPIFKIKYLINKNVINKIYVFFGQNKDIPDPSNLFITDPNNDAFKSIFSSYELTEIQGNQIEVIFINENIHIDDTIGMIKLKIVDAFLKSFSEEEIYLYCLKEEIINPISIYQLLTMNDTIALTKLRLEQFLLNMREPNGNPVTFDLPEKEKYSFDDILKLDLSERPVIMAKVLGQKIIMGNMEYPFIVDPYYVNTYDVLLERSRKEMSTLNSSLLLDSGIIYNNTIYVCLAENVFNYNEQKSIPIEYTSKIYYPFLYKNNVSTIEDLQNKKIQFMDNTTNKLSSSVIKNFKNIDMFYDVFQYRKNSNAFSLNGRHTGVKYMKIIIHPSYKVKIPIDVIFKLIHATKINPLIKYNESSRQESMYRLYTNQLSVSGKKIPYLSKVIITKLIKGIGKKKSVSVYSNITYENQSFNIITEFEETGTITMYPLQDFDTPIQVNDLESINPILSLAVNPLIEQIKLFFEQSGYKMNPFTSILEPNIEIRDLKYQTGYFISENIDISQLKGCIQSVFTIESSVLSKDHSIEMRFKRVSNFNKHDSQESFIIEKQKQGLSIEEIVEELLANYEDLNEEAAYDMIDKLISELQVTRGANKKRAIEIKINPGFKTSISLKPIVSEIIISVEGINDFSYLKTIPLYLDSIIRITQDINSTEYNVSTIQDLCYGNPSDEIRMEDITASSEQPFLENELPVVSNNEIVYSQTKEQEENNMDDLLDMLGYNDSDLEEDDESMHGGEPSNSSSEPLESLSSIGSQLEGDILENISTPPFKVKIPSDENNKLSIMRKTSTPEPILMMDKNKKTVQTEQPIRLEIDDVNNSEPETKKEEEEEEEKDNEEEIEEEEKEPIPQISELTKQKIQNVKENNVKNIEGLQLKNPYYFQEKLEEREPNIFLTLRQGKFDGYSRMCPSSVKRQPVIVTKDEMKELYTENPTGLMGEYKDGKYNGPDALEYGSNPDDQFYYMCPRYWCLLTNKPLTSKEVREGACGGKDAIIDKKDERKVPKGKYIYQFYDENTTHYPGFHKENTPNGLCIPCCYNSWNLPAQKKRRDKCKNDGKTQEIPRKGEKLVNIVEGEKGKEREKEKESEATEESDIPVSIKPVKEAEQYVKGPEKYPLGDNRWGYLPFSIQTFLNEVNADCQISKTNTNIKPFHSCFLRHGVENNESQSFIACIANALFYGDKDETTKKNRITKFIPTATYDVPSIEIMKKLIIQGIDLDKFVTYQNGDLLTSFASDMNVDETIYYTSKLYKKIQISAGGAAYEMEFFKKAVKAFENFKLFLKDKTVTIDYTYLWDIICSPNAMLFETGINLIILEIMDNDITNNVELICPTNHYSNHIYDTKKRCLFLIKHDQFFEPIYSYRNEEKRISIVKTFSEHDPHLSKSLRNIFRKIIKPTLKEKCKPLQSMPNIYKFKPATLLDDLIVELIKRDYTNHNQVLNFQGKVIGLLTTSNKGLSGFIPCFPSSMTTMTKNKKTCEKGNCNYDFVYMTESIWNTYDETLAFLKEYYKYKEPSDGTIGKCIDGTDLCKVVEDKMIVGFLSKTNQFVQIKVPVPESEIHDNIRKVTNNNYLAADIVTQLNTKEDAKRVEYIKRIELETTFYNVFRNTIRILLNDYTNSDKRKEIQEETNNEFILYDQQLEKVIVLLKELANGYISFANIENGWNTDTMTEIYTCVSLPSDKCAANPVCMFANDKCSIVLPKQNLLTQTDNELFYYGKMADELIRYNRIRSFIFKPLSYLSFGQLKYNLREDEIIILQSLLNAEFFDNLIPMEMNVYVKQNTFDSTEPLITQPYDNIVNYDETIRPKTIDGCTIGTPSKITSNKWKGCFASNYKEIEYSGTTTCGMKLIIDIIKKYNNTDVTEEEVKDVLLEEYKRITNQLERSSTNKIGDIFIEQGKVEYGSNIRLGLSNLLEVIVSDDYMITNFDLWVLLVRYKIPSIFISSYLIPESRYNEHSFVCYSSREVNTYVFIVVPGLREQKVPTYKLIVNGEGDIQIPLNMIQTEECKTKIETAVSNYIDLASYIKSFQRDVKTNYKHKKQGVREKIIPEFEVINSLETPKPPANVDVLDDNIENINAPDILEIIPNVKPKKTRRKKNIEIKTRPHGKKTRKQTPVFEILTGSL